MKDIINKVRQEVPKVRIGKNGITEGIIREVENILRKDKVVKVRCLKIVPSDAVKAIGKNLADLTKSEIVDIRGKAIILIRR